MINKLKSDDFTHICVTNWKDKFCEYISNNLNFESERQVAVSSVSYPTIYKKRESYIKLKYSDSEKLHRVNFQLDEEPVTTLKNTNAALIVKLLPYFGTHYVSVFGEENGFTGFSLNWIPEEVRGALSMMIIP